MSASELLSSQANSGTSVSNYRYRSGADKSGARQPGTCQRGAADALWAAQRGHVLSQLYSGDRCVAQPPGTLHYPMAHPTAASAIPLRELFGKAAPSAAALHSPPVW